MAIKPNMRSLLQQLIDFDDETAVSTFLLEHEDTLLTPAAEEMLTEWLAAAPGPRTQQRIKERLLILRQMMEASAQPILPPTGQLYTLFRQSSHSLELQSLVLQVWDPDLDELEKRIAEHLQQADIVEHNEISQRLDSLRQIRASLQAQYGRFLPHVKRLNAWMQLPSWQASQDYLRQHKAEMLSDDSITAMDLLIDTDPENPVLEEHRLILQESRKYGVMQGYVRRMEREEKTAVAPEREQALSEWLLAWLQQSTLADAESYLSTHEADLLSDDGLAMMRQIVLANAGNPTAREHYRRLLQARRTSVPALYAHIRQQRLAETLADLPERGEMGAAVAHYIQVDDEEAVRILGDTLILHQPRAGSLLQQLAEVAATTPDAALADRLQSRYQLWVQMHP